MRTICRRGAGWRAAAAALAIVAAAGLAPQAYLKLGTPIAGQVAEIRWRAWPVRYYVGDSGAAGLGAAEVRAALERAFAAWEGVASASVAFRFAGTTAADPADADGLTTVGFVARPDLDRVLGTTAFVIDVTTGEIVEAGVSFNSAYPWSTAAAGEAGKYDLESIAVHEFGHLLGLGHSAIGETSVGAGGRRVLAAEAVMFPIAYAPGSTAGRVLKADDRAGVSDLYPAPSFRAETGGISGRVTKSGAGVRGAHVVAFNVATRALVGGFTLDASGAFAIAGLEPGSYIVRVEPLDDADAGAFFGGGAVDADFGVTYLAELAIVTRGGSAGPYAIEVAAR